MVIGTINAVISGLLFGSGGILLGIVSFCLYSILSFSYVICCVGPYETSVRLRIVRELYKQPQGMRLERLLGFYNNRRILDLRLQRLLASKDLILENGVYRDNRGSSVFTGITAITEFLKRCYGV